MELKIYFRMIIKNWWMILLTMFVCVNATLFMSYTSPVLYRTTAKFVVSPSLSLFSGQELIDSMKALENRTIVNTYNEMVLSDTTFQITLETLGIDFNDPDLENVRRTSVIPNNTNFIEITVEGENPEMIAAIANTMGEEGGELVNELYSNTYEMSIFDVAPTPTVPYSPNPVQDVAVAFVLSMVVGICLAFLVEQIKMPLDEIRKRNQMDKVANCYTTKYFMYTIEQSLLEEDTKPISIGLIEFTGLTTLLENLPSAVQQNLLTRLTHLLRNEVRGNDVIGRMGTASFGIMMCSTPDFAAHKTMDRILRHMAISLPIDEDKVFVSPIGNSGELYEGEPVMVCIDRIRSNMGKASKDEPFAGPPAATKQEQSVSSETNSEQAVADSSVDKPATDIADNGETQNDVSDELPIEVSPENTETENSDNSPEAARSEDDNAPSETDLPAQDDNEGLPFKELKD